MFLPAKKLIYTSAFAMALFFFISPAHAATLYFSPSEGTLGPGSKIEVDVQMDVTDCVNAVEADISFPRDYMQLSDFAVGESILALWVKQPNEADIKEANKTGILNFIGGVPGGYCGKIPGDTGQSNTVAKLIFNVPSMLIAAEERSTLDLSFLSSTKVLLNDGFGTADALTTKSASFSFQKQPVQDSDNWSKELEADTIPPEPFVIELNRKKDVFGGKYYIIFNTVDKQSGMDHYEVLEIRRDQELGAVKGLSWWEKLLGRKKDTVKWKRGSMPYLLEDQDLLSTIRVKAVDKAGNERFVEFIPDNVSKPQVVGVSGAKIALVAFGLALFILLSIVVIRALTIKKPYDRE